MGKPKKYYAVARGRNPGIFTAWFGPGGAEGQIRRYPGARYRGFPSIEEARKWMENQAETAASAKKKGSSKAGSDTAPDGPGDTTGKILVYTDGGCRGNPGPGGYNARRDRSLGPADLAGPTTPAYAGLCLTCPGPSTRPFSV